MGRFDRSSTTLEGYGREVAASAVSFRSVSENFGGPVPLSAFSNSILSIIYSIPSQKADALVAFLEYSARRRYSGLGAIKVSARIIFHEGLDTPRRGRPVGRRGPEGTKGEGQKPHVEAALGRRATAADTSAFNKTLHSPK
ncbi:hypothetical protein EVAR_3086_1 [Eumeta japonica]|uniref:Uncharacterized protein n=1 Tax=Eumeta variegata TaxID=151549 RepID=A0A4C1STR6_EUMVA|nr:hypothetical protein EVAR_3086_1 [Eumeta japonica]